MRIDLYGSQNAESIAQVAKKADQAADTKTQSSAQKASSEDTATLSSGADSVQSLKSIALQPTPARAAKVTALKQSVDNAQYQLDAAKIAEALVNSEF